MSKSKEELDTLKKEVESVNEKLAELTPEEIAQVTGGGVFAHCVGAGRLGAEIDHYSYREYDN